MDIKFRAHAHRRERRPVEPNSLVDFTEDHGLEIVEQELDRRRPRRRLPLRRAWRPGKRPVSGGAALERVVQAPIQGRRRRQFNSIDDLRPAAGPGALLQRGPDGLGASGCSGTRRAPRRRPRNPCHERRRDVVRAFKCVTMSVLRFLDGRRRRRRRTARARGASPWRAPGAAPGARRPASAWRRRGRRAAAAAAARLASHRRASRRARRLRDRRRRGWRSAAGAPRPAPAPARHHGLELRRRRDAVERRLAPERRGLGVAGHVGERQQVVGAAEGEGAAPAVFRADSAAGSGSRRGAAWRSKRGGATVAPAGSARRLGAGGSGEGGGGDGDARRRWPTATVAAARSCWSVLRIGARRPASAVVGDTHQSKL